MGAAIDLAATYTETDPNGRLTQSTVTATFTGVKRDENAYLYKDWGAGYFGDFVHDFQTTGVTWANGSKFVVWGVSDTVAAMSGWTAGLYLMLNASSTTAGTYTLGEVGGAAGTSVGASIAKTIMYWRIERNSTTLTAKRASSAANRTAGTFVETLTISCANTTFRYHFAGSTFNDANTTAVTQTTANHKGTKMTSAATPFDTAYMAGASSGDWNAGATWGNAGAVKGTDYPGSANDITNIDVGDTVTYNVEETNLLYAMDIYGTLTFKKDMTTLLSFADQKTLTVKSTGSLIVGEDGDPIQSAYTASLKWNHAGARTSISCDLGATLSLVGADIIGSKHFSYLTADWTAGQTFTVNGDATAWQAGQVMYVHKFKSSVPGGTDGGAYTIASVAANGGNTDITINEAAPGVTFRAGGIVTNMTRNVFLGQVGGAAGSGRMLHAGTSKTASVATTKFIMMTAFAGVGSSSGGGIWDTTYCSWYNCEVGDGNYYCFGTHTKMVSIGGAYVQLFADATFNECVFGEKTRYHHSSHRCTYNDCYFFNYPGYPVFSTYTGTWNGGATFNNCDFVNGYLLSTNIWNFRFFNCNFGKFRHHANTCVFTQDIAAGGGGFSAYFYNCYFVNDPLVFASGWWGNVLSVVASDDHRGTIGDSRKWTGHLAMKSNTTVVRGGGSATSLELWRMDSVTRGTLSEPVFEWVEWDVPASEQTRQIYIRGGNGGAEDWSTYPTAAELYLEAEYYDEAGTTHKAFAVSTAVLTDNTTWTAFPVTFTPGRVGQVVYRLRLGLVTGVASVKLYVDPQLNS